MNAPVTKDEASATHAWIVNWSFLSLAEVVGCFIDSLSINGDSYSGVRASAAGSSPRMLTLLVPCRLMQKISGHFDHFLNTSHCSYKLQPSSEGVHKSGGDTGSYQAPRDGLSHSAANGAGPAVIQYLSYP